MNNICLWINGVKVSDAQGITDNFNITDVRGYFLGGSLVPWLENLGEHEKADALKSITAGENPDKMLYDIFTGNYTKPVYHKGVVSNAQSPTGQSSYRLSSMSGSFSLGSYKTGSYNLGSYNVGSFRKGSYHEYEFEYELGSFFSGSFAKYLSSFFSGSFAQYLGSFKFSSFTFSAGSFVFGSFKYDDFLIDGKFCPAAPVIKNLTSEPLNRFGYGIHII